MSLQNLTPLCFIICFKALFISLTGGNIYFIQEEQWIEQNKQTIKQFKEEEHGH